MSKENEKELEPKESEFVQQEPDELKDSDLGSVAGGTFGSTNCSPTAGCPGEKFQPKG